MLGRSGHVHSRVATLVSSALIVSAVACSGAASSDGIVILLVPEDGRAPAQVSRPARAAGRSPARSESASVADQDEPGRASRPNSPPGGRRTRPQPPMAGMETEVKNLASKHGINVRGSYNKKDIEHTLNFARDFRPEETKGLTFIFERNRNGRSSGSARVKTLGWYKGGVSHIVSPNPDTVYHEGVHHITMAPANKRTVAIGNEVYRAAIKLGGATRKPANSTITRWYAKENSYEFKAEFFTGLAALEHGLKLDFTIANRGFKPPESIRKIARPIYASGGRR
jgi:hypothetical protein